MRNNTIEIRLTSYGTLEVVTIPVKLYKDSYKVVKLRVSAVEKENSFLKVYASDRDEAGEQVWTSATHDLPYVDKEIINGVTYNVYEDYLPQEFCTKDEVNITFAHVVEADGVEQILTSGTLNLTIGGEGFNYNGTQIPQQDSLAIKVNKILEGTFHYDLVISTQAEFEAFINSLEKNMCSAKSVLFVGDGGNLEFTKEIDYYITIPQTLKRIDGLNNPILHFIMTGNTVFLKYDNYSELNSPDYSMSNIKFILETSATKILSGLRGFNNLYNIEIQTIGGYDKIADSDTISGVLADCNNLINCTVDGDLKLRSYTNCDNMVNCKGYIYYLCNNISNSKGLTFGTCNYLTNCLAENNESLGVGFTYSSYLTNCEAIGSHFYSFANCNYLTNCTGDKSIRNCTYIASTQEDIDSLQQYVDDKIGKVNTALTDLNSGEGV